MGPHRSRRQFLAMTAGLAVAAGCSKSGVGGDGSRPVTVKHVFGETTVPAPPARVVSAGLTDADDLLAVGVIPIAVTRWLGDQPSGLWPWAQAKFDEAKPAVLNLDNGIQVDAIAALKPDLIVAVNAGLDSDTYKKLSDIAPTIAQSGGDAFFEPWKDQAAAIARAVYRSDQMDQQITAVEQKFAAVAQGNPRLKDRTVALMNVGTPVDPANDAVSGWRTDFLAAMGLRVAGSAADADAVIWCVDSDDQRAALLADPSVAKLRATKQGHTVFTTPELSAAIAYASPLSYPVVADQLPGLLAKALG